MQQINKDLYVEVSNVWDLNQKIKEGYELVTPISRSIKSTDYSSGSTISGTFLNNPISLNTNGHNVTTIAQETWYLLKLSPNADLLYGKS